eukprot:g3023.t1
MKNDDEKEIEEKKCCRKEELSFLERVRRHANETKDQTHALYVNLTLLRRHLLELQNAFPKDTIHAIAMKASPIRGVMKEVKNSNCGVETASLGELKIALKHGFSTHGIVYDSPAKTDDELRFALKQDKLILNLDNLEEVERVAFMIEKEKIEVNAVVGLRINPCVGKGTINATSTAYVGSKFGVCLKTHGSDKIVSLFKKYNGWLTALHCHVGSGGCGLKLLVRGVKRICHLASLIRKQGCDITHIDIGGGVPLLYECPDKAPTFQEYASVLRTEVPDLFLHDHKIVTEFGRRVHSTTGVCVSKVAATKISGDSKIAIIHIGADCFLRTAYMPGSWDHRVSVWTDTKRNSNIIKKNSKTEIWSIAGPLCFSGDFVARNISLPPISRNDVVVIHDTGAYTLGMWSRYNSRRSPAVWGISEDDSSVVLLRHRESISDVSRFWD